MARILTGIQSTGTPHLGNLLGAIIPAIKLSEEKENESLFFIADLHSFTAIRDAETLRNNTYATAAAWLAFGFDTDKKPDVYLIVLDGYAGAKSLEDNFGFDNSNFLNSLSNSNFYVSKNNFTNYEWSNLSMNALLNMNYLDNYPDYSIDDYLLLRDLYNSNLVMKTFQTNGYQTFFIDGGAPFRNIHVSTETLCHATDNGLLQNLIDTSMISLVSKKFSTISWNEIRTCAFEELENIQGLNITVSLGYLDFMKLVTNSQIVITDSGGIQEEATSPVIRKKVLVIRKTTDRPEAVESNLAKIIGLDEKIISKSIKKTMIDPKVHSKKTPYGKGDASEKILKLLQKYF